MIAIGATAGCGSGGAAATDAATKMEAGQAADAAPRTDAAPADVGGQPSLQNALPFQGGVYVQGQLVHGGVGLRRFWPTPEVAYHAGFDDLAHYVAFRPTDGQIFYVSAFTGLHIDDRSDAMDTIIQTPPCNGTSGAENSVDFLDDVLGWDAGGTVHYDCLVPGEYLRGSGEIVRQPTRLAAVLADGRAIVYEPSFMAVDSSGQPLAILAPSTIDFPGNLMPLPSATTVRDNDAFVLLSRAVDQQRVELVVFRLDAESRWSLVRRAPTPLFGIAQLAISDGTIFLLNNDMLGDDVVYALLPDGTQQIVFHGATSSLFVPTGLSALVAGPREANGPSTMSP